jgi:hypothetical protein
LNYKLNDTSKNIKQGMYYKCKFRNHIFTYYILTNKKIDLVHKNMYVNHHSNTLSYIVNYEVENNGI